MRERTRAGMSGMALKGTAGKGGTRDGASDDARRRGSVDDGTREARGWESRAISTRRRRD